MGNKEVDDLVTLIITTVHPGGTQVTGNLLAPLVLDSESRRGAQLTQDDAKYGGTPGDQLLQIWACRLRRLVGQWRLRKRRFVLG